MAKRILPVFGGSASVWVVCLVFYQSLLLAGYCYSHVLARRLKPRQQGLLHLAVVICAVAFLPLAGAAIPPSSGTMPASEIVFRLWVSIGLPYLLLASTSPLIQYWDALRNPGGQAYRLFAWSNLSCAVALLAFPLVLERSWPISSITMLWQACFVVAALFHAVSAIRLWRSRDLHALELPAVPRDEGSRRMPLLWLFFSFLGSALFVATTEYLCVVVAPIPLLWVLPLLLYLLTFVVAFEGTRYSRNWGIPLGVAGLVAMAAAGLYLPPQKMMGPGIFIYCGGLFAACLMCHGELALRKPPERDLTRFYIILAFGGALGSVFVALLAPLLLKHMVELPFLLAIAGISALALVYGRNIAMDLTVIACTIFLLGGAFASWLVSQKNSLAAGRNFYGALRVTQSPPSNGMPALRTIVHGSINHGAQYVEGEWRRTPLTYFHEKTAVGMLLKRPGGPRRVGIIGLGAGTLAAYGRDGDVLRFYEINPLVVQMATEYFAYLNDSAARVEVILGDARINMEREQPQHYDVLVVDAFTGDSVPAHLLTREAFQVYLRHLSEGGTLALHVSNLHLNLPPVVQEIARSLHLSATVIASGPNPPITEGGALWVLVDRRPPAASVRPVHERLLWTDDRSSLLSVLR